MGEKGEKLISTLVQLTGLPDGDIRTELDKILAESGTEGKDLTLDELRKAMMLYLESIDASLVENSTSQASAAGSTRH